MRIDPTADLVTLVVTMHVDPALIDEKLAIIRQSSRGHADLPGFVSCAIHKSQDNTRIVEYVQCESLETVAAMRQAVEDQSPPPDFALMIDHTLLEVVDIVDSSTT